MKRSLNGLWPLALLGLFLAQAAHADVIDDVVRGTNIRLNAARIHVKGNDYGTGYWLLPKAAGTLNLNVPARQFGINSDLVLRMHGSRSGNVITWTFNDALPSPYYLGSANSVTRVRGTLKALARQVRGADDPYCDSAACPHNVELVLTSGSSVYVDGYTDIVFKFNWTEPVYMRQFVAYGGVPRPRLSSMVVVTPTSRCPSPNATELYGDVVLSSPAPTGGILVDLMSVDARVGVLPVRIPEAQRSARFTVRLPPNWTGPTVIYGASGGVRRSVRLSVPECIRNPFLFTRYLRLEYHLAPLGLLKGGALVARNQETDSDVLVTAKGETHRLNEVLRVEKARVVGINTAGDVFGTAYTSKGAHAFRLRSDDVKAGPEVWLDGWEAVTANAHGTMLVRDPHKPEGLFLLDEVGPAPLSVVSKLKPRDLRFNALGEAAVTVETEKGLRAARVYGDKVNVLVDTESEVHAVNDVGVFVGAVREGDKFTRPFIWSNEKELRWLPLPEGFVSARVVAINDGGWVLGTATAEDGKTQTAFLVPPESKEALRLDDLLPEDLKKDAYRVTRALALAEDFGVAVLAMDGQGQRVHLVLRP
ncbi:hypothetical protein [Comamonas sp. JC664]|uniref:hypothetical protein n=1 Tax=Comamonas sp. JC664 TaxID=2801917 RepID=UPI00174D70E7|nr:hypothetical protein [Comamonas sp. JC664]MBL0695292.1 hypothetical protein [Comamonas sp. JC664]GHG87238.1 hypothetical protein GCM10012319_44890 [Comamonas sp. KCTC 72670]